MKIMRHVRHNQLEFQPQNKSSIYTRELQEIARILETLPQRAQLLEQVKRDIVRTGRTDTGAEGMTAEQVLRCALVRSIFNLPYRELAFALEDSASIRAFVGVGFGKRFSSSALNRNIRLIREETWKRINEAIKSYAQQQGIENGKTIRGDTTTTETNIHYPTDTNLLWDCIRVLTRIMRGVREETTAQIEFTDHARRAKSRLYELNNSRKEQQRHQCSLELIRLARWTVSSAEAVLVVVEKAESSSFQELLLLQCARGELRQYIPLAKRCLEQAYRRHVLKEEVPNADKLVSIFEPHTDIIVKGFRDTVFGHKLHVVSGKSSLILDCEIYRGNPADTSLVKPILDEHQRCYDSAPKQVAFDGGFASQGNLREAKDAGTTDVMFAKTRGLAPEELTSSPRAFRVLRRFRAGIEANISLLKRKFGWDRILERGFAAFRCVVRCAVVSFNLLLLARAHLRAQAT